MIASRVLLNASNLHVGGGVQVATSIIGEMAMMDTLPKNFTIWASSIVHENLKSLNYDLSKFTDYRVIDNFGLKSLRTTNKKSLYSFSRVLTIFGPFYTFNRSFYNIVGFAQPWIIYPNNEISKELSIIDRIKTRIKFLIQQQFFKRADEIIVELDHVANGLVENKITASNNVNVIHNCVSSIFLEPTRWKKIDHKFTKDCIKLGFVGRNYAHKNTKIFPLIKSILKSKFSFDVEFYVTFSKDEWESCSNEFKNEINNVGALTVDQCPSFYNNVDAIVFPSFLECFSATPLEAMITKKTLFASDKPFNHDICEDCAIYFDANDPYDAAEKIYNFFKNEYLKKDYEFKVNKAYEHALKFANSKKRADLYLEYLFPKV